MPRGTTRPPASLPASQLVLVGSRWSMGHSHTRLDHHHHRYRGFSQRQTPTLIFVRTVEGHPLLCTDPQIEIHNFTQRTIILNTAKEMSIVKPTSNCISLKVEHELDFVTTEQPSRPSPPTPTALNSRRASLDHDAKTRRDTQLVVDLNRAGLPPSRGLHHW